MMGLATALAALGGMGGIYLSYYADTAAGASIAAVIVALHVAVAAVLRINIGRPSAAHAAEAA